VLILGSLGELARLVVESDSDRTRRLAGAAQVGFRRFVQPGDQLELTVTVKSRSDDSTELTSEAKVDGKVVTRARRLTLAPTGT
jgi:3-hydroxymyristoyl/3-hydroxydecanoyl-(acyl carrier protein) dehydratase